MDDDNNDENSRKHKKEFLEITMEKANLTNNETTNTATTAATTETSVAQTTSNSELKMSKKGDTNNEFKECPSSPEELVFNQILQAHSEQMAPTTVARIELQPQPQYSQHHPLQHSSSFEHKQQQQQQMNALISTDKPNEASLVDVAFTINGIIDESHNNKNNIATTTKEHTLQTQQKMINMPFAEETVAATMTTICDGQFYDSATASVTATPFINNGNSNSLMEQPECDKEPEYILKQQQQQAQEQQDQIMQEFQHEMHELEIDETTPTTSVRSIGSLVCRICHNSENPERLVSPCLCKGSLTYVHIHCLERWISTSRSTTCELCQFQYNTEQRLRYTLLQSLRMWYSRSMSRRALQEDCQMFSLLTLVAFGIIGTLLVGIQYYFLQEASWQGIERLWTKGWLIFFLSITLAVYVINIYMIVRSQLTPWYRWWQSARDIKLVLENRKPFKFRSSTRFRNHQLTEQLSSMSMYEASPTPQLPRQQQQQQHQQQGPEQQQGQHQQQQQQSSNHINAALSLQVLPPLQPSTLILPYDNSVDWRNSFLSTMKTPRTTGIASLNFADEANGKATAYKLAPPLAAATAVVTAVTVATAGVAAAAVEVPLDGFIYEVGNIL